MPEGRGVLEVDVSSVVLNEIAASTTNPIVLVKCKTTGRELVFRAVFAPDGAAEVNAYGWPIRRFGGKRTA